MTTTSGNGNGPLEPTNVNGELRILDLDLAARLGFAKSTKIRDLIKRHRVSLETMGTLPAVGRVINGGEAVEFYLNRKQAIFITAKSETAEATDITIEIIEKFDAYERGDARPTDPLAVLNDPAAMRGLLLTYTEKVLELKAKVEEQAPAVAALDRLSKANGSMCITDAAKDLQVRPSDLFKFLRQKLWIYSRPGKAGDIAYQDKIQAGLLEHKVTTVSRSDGPEKTVEQVRVTAKGLARLAKLLGGTSSGAPSLFAQKPGGLGNSPVHAPVKE